MSPTPSGQAPLPTFLIIGAERGATRWLRSNLDRHPEVFAPPITPDWFTDVEAMRSRGRRWYQQQFDAWAGEPVLGEASVSYMKRVSRAGPGGAAHPSQRARGAAGGHPPAPGRSPGVGGAPVREARLPAGRRRHRRPRAAPRSDRRPPRPHRGRPLRHLPLPVRPALRRAAHGGRPRRRPRPARQGLRVGAAPHRRLTRVHAPGPRPGPLQRPGHRHRPRAHRRAASDPAHGVPARHRGARGDARARPVLVGPGIAAVRAPGGRHQGAHRHPDGRSAARARRGRAGRGRPAGVDDAGDVQQQTPAASS